MVGRPEQQASAVVPMMAQLSQCCWDALGLWLSGCGSVVVAQPSQCCIKPVESKPFQGAHLLLRLLLKQLRPIQDLSIEIVRSLLYLRNTPVPGAA
eukprot:1140612-Pelagomonas_calceolata.AAC.3